jgi:hypothetical protein
VTRERFDTLVAELYGDRSSPAFQPTARPSAQQAIVQAAEQIAAPPAAPVDPARLTKAMDLVLANAVSLLPDGTARVKSGSHTYHLAPDCTCEDAQRRGTGCKHTLAVEIHRRATARLEGTTHAPAGSTVPAASSASQLAAAFVATPPVPPEALSRPVSAAWDVHEAPASWNTVYMAAVVEQLKQEGMPVQDSDLAHVWPTRYAHINMYGKYYFNVAELHSRTGLRPLRPPGRRR